MRLPPQIGQHGENPAMLFVVWRQHQLGENVADVLLHRAVTDHEGVGDVRVGAALGHQREHLPLTHRQLPQRVVTSPSHQQLGDHLPVEHRTARGHPVHRVEELRDRGDPVLQ